MDMDSLRVFKAVAQEGSVSRAAAALHCVPSNVTARIRNLEGELGVKLFARKPRGMDLTAPGKRLLEYARRALALLSEARAVVAGGGRPAGPLCIGATESVAVNRLPDLVIGYSRACPEVEFSLRVADSGQLVRMVLDNQVEGAFVSRAAQDARLASEEVFVEELCILFPPGRKYLTDESCSSVVLQRPGCAYREALELWLARTGKKVRRRLEMPAPEVALACVAAGLGIAAMPRSALDRMKARDLVGVRKMPLDVGRVPIHFIWDRRCPPSPALEAFKAHCLGNG